MKRLILVIALALTSSGIIATPALANGGPMSMCSESAAAPCIESFAFRGAGVSDWTTISAFTAGTDTTVNLKTYVFDTAGTAYSPSAGFGTQIKVSAYGLNPTNANYTVTVNSNNGTSQAEAKGDHFKHLDPSTEVRVAINAGAFDTRSYISVNMSRGSTREYSVVGGNNILRLSGKVTRRTSGDDWNGSARRMESGVIEFRGTAPGLVATFNGISIDSDAQSGSTPFFQGDPSSGFKFTAAAPHFLTDGTTLNTGYYSAVVPASFISGYGLTQEMVVASGASVIADYAGTVTPLTSSVTAEADGAVRITADGFSYSQPTLTTSFNGRPQTANVGAAIKKGKKLTLPIKTTQGITTSWKSTSPKICKVTSTKKTTNKKVGKKTVKTVTITKWQVQGKKKGTCTVVGTNSGNSSFGPANISKTISVN
jgi:hypothetical protein